MSNNVSQTPIRKNKCPERRISCKDLGEGDCEGWLWIKKINTFRNKFIRRWCVLKKNCFYFYKHTEDTKAEGVIQVQDFKVSPIEKFKNNNFYFKIHNEEINFTFASDTQSDFTKWLNKLQLSASKVEISNCEGSVGGFSPPYVRSASSTLKSNDTIFCENSPSGIRSARVMSRYSESEDSDVDSDRTSEDATNSNKIANEEPKLRCTLSAAEKVTLSNRSTEDLNELTMTAIKRIVEIERLIRGKKLMLTSIDQFLKFPTTSERIRQFWDDYNKEILAIVLV